MHLKRTLLILAMVGFFCTIKCSAQEKKIALVPIKYAGLKQEVLKHRGKVVVLDFWAGT